MFCAVYLKAQRLYKLCTSVHRRSRPFGVSLLGNLGDFELERQVMACYSRTEFFNVRHMPQSTRLIRSRN